MPINFPNSPSLGQLYTFGETTWQWSGEYWNVYSAQTGYITSVSSAGGGIPVIESVTSNALTLKSFSGTNLTITDNNGLLNFYVPLNGGGGGQLYYFNISKTQDSYFELATSATTGTEQTITSGASSGTTVTLGQFLTSSGFPGVSIIPGGVWTFFLHAYKQNASASFNIYCDVYKRTTGGTNTLLLTTDPVPITANSPTPLMFVSDAYYSGSTIDTSDRLLVNVRATNTGTGTTTVTFVSEGTQHYSYMSSPLLLRTADIYVNSFEYTPSANTITIGQTENFPPLSVQIDRFSGLTIDSGLTASVISATTYSGLPNTLYTGDGSLSGNRVVNIGSNTLNFSSSTQPNTLVLSGGNVGIGISNPTARLQISGGTVIGTTLNPLLDMTQTWSTTGTPTSIRLTVANLSGTSGNLLDFLVGSTLTGATTVFSVNRIGTITGNGNIRFTNGDAIISGPITAGASIANGTTISNIVSNPSTDVYGLNNTRTINPTGGNLNFINYTGVFNPTTAISSEFRGYNLAPQINQTGGANGITRGLYVNPSLTSAADWRSIEWSNNSGWGLYGVGAANNYLAGSLGIGTVSLANSNLRITKQVAGGTSINSVIHEGLVNSSVTSNANIFVSTTTTQNASFTLGNLRHFSVTPDVRPAASTITNEFGFVAGASLVNGTNNFGFYGDIPVGTNRWNLYMNGTAPNYLAGNLAIGTTTATSASLTISGATQTGSSAIGSVNILQTWNTTGTVDGLIVNVTNTASNSNSQLAVFRTNGNRVFGIDPLGQLNIGHASNVNGIFCASAIGSYGSPNNPNLGFYNNTSTNDSAYGSFGFGGTNIVGTSGTFNLMHFNRTFVPPSGTAVFNTVNIPVTINQTGGANGITRGLYVNPSLTSAADWRSIESTNGRVVLTDTYSASGTSANPILDLAQTWNTSGQPTAFRLNVTDLSSNTFSYLTTFQVGGTNRFIFRKDGVLHFGANIGSPAIWTLSTNTLHIGGSLGSTSGYNTQILPFATTTRNITGGQSGAVRIFSETFAPTSGGATYEILNISGTINQTGGANGITRGLLISPTLTSASDFRVLETMNGRVVLTDTYSASGSSANPILSLVQTFNTSGTPTAFRVSVTNTSASTSSLLMDLRGGTGGTTSLFSVRASDGLTNMSSAIISSGLTATTISATTYQNLPSQLSTKNFGIVIDGGGSPITTGVKGDLVIPYNMTINSWTILADTTGSTVIDIWKDPYSIYPPVSGDTIITGGTKPNITNSNKNQSVSLTGWNPTITAGDILRFNVDSASTITRITLSLNGIITS